jgi:pyruvate/2-oxoglutarate dehydrogenase complex dihydrolipoamide dehydrogenase (E3) component
VVVATGARPAVPAIPGLADLPYWTNREAVEAKELPVSMVVLGSGAIGLELAQVFARFGVRVTVVESRARILPAEEPEASTVLAEVLAADAIEVRPGCRVVSAGRRGADLTISLEDGSVVSGERLLVATGRRSNLAALGVSRVGLDERAPFLTVDDHLRAAPGLWAVGDVTGVGAFTHVALYQAAIAAADILGEYHSPADYRAMPRVTFTDPEVASVGLSAAAAGERGVAVRIGFAKVPQSARGWIHQAGNEGFIKLVADTARGVLVGATCVGPAGGEILSMLTLAIHAEVPLDALQRMIYAYPTFHRAIEDALHDLAV